MHILEIIQILHIIIEISRRPFQEDFFYLVQNKEKESNIPVSKHTWHW